MGRCYCRELQRSCILTQFERRRRVRKSPYFIFWSFQSLHFLSVRHLLPYHSKRRTTTFIEPVKSNMQESIYGKPVHLLREGLKRLKPRLFLEAIQQKKFWILVKNKLLMLLLWPQEVTLASSVGFWEVLLKRFCKQLPVRFL